METAELSRILKAIEVLAKNNPLFQDPIYCKCLMLALQSNCQKGHYGCIVKHKGKIVARTYNKVMFKDWCTPECIRKKIQSRTESMIGCCDHAEEKAIVVIRNLGLNPKDCEFYAAGFRSNGLPYIKPETDFDCLRCATQMYQHKVGKIYVPVINKWESLTAKQAVETAKLFARKIKKLTNYE